MVEVTKNCNFQEQTVRHYPRVAAKLSLRSMAIAATGCGAAHCTAAATSGILLLHQFRPVGPQQVSWPFMATWKPWRPLGHGTCMIFWEGNGTSS